MAELEMKAHDTDPCPETDLSFADGTSPDLTGATVTFIMSLPNLPPKVRAAAQILQTNPQGPATVRYNWALDGSDTDQASLEWRAEWEVVFPNGRKRTFPQKTYHSIEIVPDVDYYAVQS